MRSVFLSLAVALIANAEQPAAQGLTPADDARVTAASVADNSWIDEPLIFPRPSKNQQRPGGTPTSFACDTTCYCNKRCNASETLCINAGSDTCRNGLYCDTCSENCFASNPC